MTQAHPGERRRRGLAAIVLLALLGGGLAGAWWLLRPTTSPTTVDALLGQARAESLAGELSEDEAFRLALTEAELARLLRAGLSETPAALETVTVRVDGGSDSVRLHAEGDAARASLRLAATLEARAVDGGLSLEVTSSELSGLALPGVADDALGDLLAGSGEVGERLAREGVTVEEVTAEQGVLVIAGRAEDPERAATQLREAFGAVGRPAPPERVGPGRLAVRDEPGPRLVLAIGDSVAAGTGATDHRDAATSRVHGALERLDGDARGYRNLAEPGATAADVVAGGQLEAASAIVASGEVGLVVVSVGGNELLDLLEGGPCAADLASSACDDALAGARDELGEELATILEALQAAGRPEVVVLAPYNPFSVGGGGEAERRTDEAAAALTATTRAVASEHGARVADPAADFAGRAGSLTLLGAADPDIHPTARGHDVLAAAILEAAGRDLARLP